MLWSSIFPETGEGEAANQGIEFLSAKDWALMREYKKKEIDRSERDILSQTKNLRNATDVTL